MEWKAAFRSYDYVKKNENAIVFLDFNKETKVRSSKLTRDYTLLRPGKTRFHPELKETWTTLKFYFSSDNFHNRGTIHINCVFKSFSAVSSQIKRN